MDFNTIIKIITILASAVTAVATLLNILSKYNLSLIVLFKSNLLQRRRKINRLNALKEAHLKFDKFETEFEKNLIEPELRETEFFIISGIETNYTSIPMYWELKRKLGLNYNWSGIKRAKDHFDLKGKAIKINLKQWQIWLGDFTLFMFFASLAMMPIIFYKLNPDDKPNLILNLIALFVSIIPIIASYFLFITGADSILMANAIKKRLEFIEANKE